GRGAGASGGGGRPAGAAAGGGPRAPPLARLPARAPRSALGPQQRRAVARRAYRVSARRLIWARRLMSAPGWGPASVPPPKSALKSLPELAEGSLPKRAWGSLPKLARGPLPRRASASPPAVGSASPPCLPRRTLLKLGSLPLAISRLRSHPSLVVQPLSRRRTRAAGFPPPAVGFSLGLRAFWP